MTVFDVHFLVNILFLFFKRSYLTTEEGLLAETYCEFLYLINATKLLNIYNQEFTKSSNENL